MLDRFARAKQAEIKRLHELKRAGGFPSPSSAPRQSLEEALRRDGPGAIVAEYKRASPSKGRINLELGPVDVARSYYEGGATALSVLTEETYFQGSLDFLFAMHDLGLPLLRKDFLLDPVQVEHTAATPASALLLIVRMFEDQQKLAAMYSEARRFGLEAVFEIFSQSELNRARDLSARIIQVNNRDLSTLQVDTSLSEQLISGKKEDEVWISASGISRPEQVRSLKRLGYDGILVGTSLMERSDPGQGLKVLLGTSPGLCTGKSV